MTESSDDLLSQLDKFKNDYYKTNSKNVFLKKSQKKDIALQVSNNFNLNDLLKRTLIIIPDTHHIIFDYTVFKHYAHDENYIDIINYARNIMKYCANNYGTFVLHANISSLTITSIERHRKFMEVINDLYLNTDDGLSNFFSQLYLYYPPNMMDSILKIIRPCMNADILNKFVIVSKMDSEQVYPQLLQNIQNV
jgi:hypothetical protein